MSRRGFTLLEVMLASLIGAMVLAVCGTLLFAGGRTEATLAARTEQTSDLGRTRVVMNRVFSSLLMVKRKAEPRSAGSKPTLSNPGRVVTSTNPAGDAQPADPADAVQYTPRLILEPDPALANLVMTSRTLKTEGAFHPQRLEVVLTDSPVPQNSSGEQVLRLLGVKSRSAGKAKSASKPAPADASQNADAGAATTDGADPAAGDGAAAATSPLQDDAQSTVRAVRGALEFWPQTLENQRGLNAALGSLDADGDAPILWELWWVPLDPKPDHVGDPDPVTGGVPGEPYLIAKNIRFARWIAFKDRQHRAELESTMAVDLPAYVEFQIETGAGLKSEWMFEISWANGPETPPPPVVPLSSSLPLVTPTVTITPSGAGKSGKTSGGTGGSKK